jgi:hypothetical protein
VIVEQHASMRFAWLQETSKNSVPARQSAINRLILIAYNVIWWVPLVLGFAKVVGYRTGFVAFMIITVLRAIANAVRNNVLAPEQAQTFPLRQP